MPKVLETKLDGVVLLEPEVHGDARGFMVETYRRNTWAELGIDVEFVQHNHSRSSKGTLRGLHFQTEPGQAKLVRCPRGRIFDVAVDLRRGSPTYGRWDGVLLDDRTRRSVYLSEGLAHGFVALQDDSTVMYLCSSEYSPQREHTINATDPALAIEWPDGHELVISDRDAAAPTLDEVRAAGLLPTWDEARAFVEGLHAH